jgi:cellobiose-specific phosphotransferase system component IIA
MTTTTLIIAIISLLFASVAYWRSCSKRDLELLRAKQEELTESLLLVVEQAYDASRQTLRQTAEGLHHLKDEAVEGLEQPLERAQQQLQGLERRLEETAKVARDTPVAAAQKAERSLRVRVYRLEARGSLLYAKASGVLAIRWANNGDFARAEQRLDQATALLALARETLRADHAYDEQFEVVKRSLAEATSAVRAKGQDVRQRIDQVLADADKIVGTLEADETKEAEQRP